METPNNNEPVVTDPGEPTFHKAYAAAVVVVLLYVLNGLLTGEWASVDSLAPALGVIVLPLVVWVVPNR
jgi:hypothetical protein